MGRTKPLRKQIRDQTRHRHLGPRLGEGFGDIETPYHSPSAHAANHYGYQGSTSSLSDPAANYSIPTDLADHHRPSMSNAEQHTNGRSCRRLEDMKTDMYGVRQCSQHYGASKTHSNVSYTSHEQESYYTSQQHVDDNTNTMSSYLGGQGGDGHMYTQAGYSDEKAAIPYSPSDHHVTGDIDPDVATPASAPAGVRDYLFPSNKLSHAPSTPNMTTRPIRPREDVPLATSLAPWHTLQPATYASSPNNQSNINPHSIPYSVTLSQYPRPTTSVHGCSETMHSSFEARSGPTTDCSGPASLEMQKAKRRSPRQPTKRGQLSEEARAAKAHMRRNKLVCPYHHYKKTKCPRKSQSDPPCRPHPYLSPSDARSPTSNSSRVLHSGSTSRVASTTACTSPASSRMLQPAIHLPSPSAAGYQMVQGLTYFDTPLSQLEAMGGQFEHHRYYVEGYPDPVDMDLIDEDRG